MSTALLETIAAVCRRTQTALYWVGGPVRDRLLGLESHDWDFACRRARSVAAALAQRMKSKLITLDEQNRIYRIVPRDAIPSSGRQLTLDFAELQGKTIQQDLARRDFTLNAMAMPLEKTEIIDPFGGQKDLRRKVLRGLSQKAFQEDPLRLLRAYRLASQFQLQIDPQTRRWISAEHRRLEAGGKVARERVREELLRLLGLKHASTALAAMDRSGLLTAIFPELEAGRRVGLAYYGKGGVIKHHLESVTHLETLFDRLEAGERIDFASTPEIVGRMRQYVMAPIGGSTRAAFLKLGELLHDVGKPATAQVIRRRLRFFGHEDVGAQMVRKMLEKLRFSRQEIGLIRTWVGGHMRLGNLASLPAGKAGAPQLTDKAKSRYFRDMGEEGVGMILVSLADHYCYLAKSLWGTAKDPVEKASRLLLETYYLRQEIVSPPKVIDGHRLMKQLRLKPGPVIGRLLDAVKDAQSEGKVKTADEAIAFAKKALKSKKLASPPVPDKSGTGPSPDGRGR